MAFLKLLRYKKLSMVSTRPCCGQASGPPEQQSLKERLLLYKKLSMASTRSYCGQASEPPKQQSLKERFTAYCKRLDDNVSYRIIEHLDKFEAERVAVMQKVENLILQSKTAVIDAAKHELSSGFKPIGLVLGGLIAIDSYMSGRQLEEMVTNLHGIVTELSGNVKIALDECSSLGDEIAKLTEEVSKLSMLISKEPPNPELGRKMEALLAATDKLVSEYAKKSGEKKKYGLRKIMHDIVAWFFDD